MRTIGRRMTGAALAAAALGWAAAGTASGQVTPVFHDPFLNWDFINFTGVPVNDFEIIVASPNWVPNGVYTGGLGFPNFATSTGEFAAGNPGLETKLSWSGRQFNANDIAHVGAGMAGSGRILDAYWTFNGQKVGPSIGIVYELTRVTGRRIDMVLQTTPAFAAENPNVQLGLQGIQTFMDLPASLLDLDDLTRELNLGALETFQTTPTPSSGTLPVDSFFDVFVGLSDNTNPNFEALLVADIVQITPTATTPIGRFWNLNPQSPEPAALGVAALALGALLPRRRSA